MHCKPVQIILDVPTVGGRLMLVDMAGSENIEQAGQVGFEAKMQVRFVMTKFFYLQCLLFFFSFSIFSLVWNSEVFPANFILLLTSQTAKINQGNIALKRVVESIANGDSHVPFRDSKLTMLLQVTTVDISVSHGGLDGWFT
jgi:kinesin family protein 11